MLKIIYEDNHLLVVEKPVNMPVQADSSGDRDLLSEAKDYIKRRYAKPGEVYLGLVHRLDRPVGGVMVFARTSKAAARLADAMKAHRTKKRYAAIVTGPIAPYGSPVDFIIRDEATHSSRIVPEDTAGAQRASLDFASVAEKNGRTLVDVALHTGRHHQIRVQLAGLGCPIYGDQRYNPASVSGQQIALYAYSLTIEHPTLRESMTFTSVPSGASWSDFSPELAALTNGVSCRYIDENIIAVNKAPGISCTVEDGGEDTLEARLRLAFGEIHPVHRLDAPTSGLVLFARNAAARDELTELIASRRLKKHYYAYVFHRPPREKDTLVLHAEKDDAAAKVAIYDAPTRRSKEMRTGYRLVRTQRGAERGSETSLLELELFTGRTHQIRASLAHIGCPVVGDDKYGDRQLNRAFPDRLLLAAVRIEFPTDLKLMPSLSGRTLTIEPPFEIAKNGSMSYNKIR